MHSKKRFEEVSINVKLKLAALWVSFMFLYIYVDVFALYMPHKIENIINGKVFVFDITQGFLFTALALATLPILMIFLSVLLQATINRIVNITAAIIHVPYMLFNLAGEAWVHMVFGAAVEILLLSLIIYYAWKWPHVKVDISH